MLFSQSALSSLKNGEAITLARIKPAATKAGKKMKEDTIVRFKNAKGIEVGRVAEFDAAWISKLLDLDMATFAGTAIEVAKKFHSGTSQRSNSFLRIFIILRTCDSILKS